MIKVISFDFWNTIVDESGNDERFLRRMEILQKCLTELKIKVTLDQLKQSYRKNQQLFAQIWIEEHRTPTNEERIRTMLADLAVEVPPPMIREMDDAFAEIILQIPPRTIDHSVETIRKLSREYKLAIISDTGFSSGKVIRELLRKFGILDLFQSFAFSDEIGRSKPHRDVFNSVLSGLKVKPREMVHVGDLERTDVLGAKSMGIFTIHLYRTTSGPPVSSADFVIHSYPQIFACLTNLVERTR